jgi:hypothetical protein
MEESPQSSFAQKKMGKEVVQANFSQISKFLAELWTKFCQIGPFMGEQLLQ